MHHLTNNRRSLVSVLMVSFVLLAAACGGDDEGAVPDPEPTDSSASAPIDGGRDGNDGENASDADDNADEGEGAAVCELLTTEEVEEATGYEVVNTEANTMQLHTCEWELSVPAEEEPMGVIPTLALVLMSESDYRSRTEPLETLEDLDSVGDEAKFRYTGGGQEGVPSMVYFLAMEGDQAIQIALGFSIWDDEDSAKEALTAMGRLVFDRV